MGGEFIISYPRVVMVAGELSGELHGAGLVSALRELNPHVSIIGIGGQRMREAGAELLFDIEGLAVVGVWEVVAHMGSIGKAYYRLRQLLADEPPDLLILIDYPDFNLGLARVAKRHKIKVLYYISPQVWAWRAGRAKKIARLVDKIAVILPFEAPIYQQVGLEVEFVGHPLLEVVKPKLTKQQALGRYGLDRSRPIIGLLPGSRRSEIKSLLGVILEATRLLKAQLPQAQFILPLAPSLDYRQIEAQLAQSGLGINLVAGETYEVMNVADLLITASGTATLEAALLGTPMVVVYKLSWPSYIVGRLMINTPYISLVNIVANQGVIPELIQYQATPARIASQVMELLNNPHRLADIKKRLATIRAKLGQPGASSRTAHIAMELINEG